MYENNGNSLKKLTIIPETPNISKTNVMFQEIASVEKLLHEINLYISTEPATRNALSRGLFIT